VTNFTTLIKYLLVDTEGNKFISVCLVTGAIILEV
jgi:hypothetical protein